MKQIKITKEISTLSEEWIYLFSVELDTETLRVFYHRDLNIARIANVDKETIYEFSEEEIISLHAITQNYISIFNKRIREKANKYDQLSD